MPIPAMGTNVRHLAGMHSGHRDQGLVGELWLVCVPGASGCYEGDRVVSSEAGDGGWSAGIVRAKVSRQGRRPDHKACSSH